MKTKFGIFLFCLQMTCFSIAFAGPDIIQKNDNEQDVVVGGDDSLGLGFAVSLGGVAVGDCWVSRQKNILVWARQNGKLNRWCASLYFDQIGQHLTAAKMRCQINRIRELFGSHEDCVASNQIVAPEQVNISDVVNYLVIRQDALAEESTKPIKDDIQTLYQTVEKLEERHTRPVRPQTIIQQPFLDEAKREALASIRGDK